MLFLAINIQHKCSRLICVTSYSQVLKKLHLNCIVLVVLRRQYFTAHLTVGLRRTSGDGVLAATRYFSKLFLSFSINSPVCVT
jgi:hypothetical protein